MPLKKTSEIKELFTEENLRALIDQVQQNRSSLREVALDFGIPKSTLCRY